MSTQATYLPLAEQNFPSEHAALAQAFQTTGSWVWTREDELYQPPYAPPGAVRGFRWTYTGTRAPSSITIVLSVDNYFGLHVNGALVHAANPSDELWDAFAFTVPLPAGSRKTVVAIRAFNADDTTAVMNNPAGFTAAIKLSFQGTTQTETLVTGSNMRWVGESSFPAGWENSDFDDSNWANVVVLPADSWPSDRRRSPSRLFVASSIAGGTTTTTATQTSTLVVTSTSSSSATTSLTTTSTTSSQLSTSSTSPIPDIPLPQDPTLGQVSASATGVGSSGNSSNSSNGSIASGPSPFLTGIIVGFILLTTLWPRSLRRIF